MLILFDIDGTLVRRTGPHHRDALTAAVRRVTGHETTTEGIPVQGMLDPDILTLMMRAAGMTPDSITIAMPQVIEEAQHIYMEHDSDFRACVCPGVPRILETLQAEGAVLALVTGNLTRIGWRKLALAGIDRYFRFGAFGEIAATRGDLAGLAIAEARRQGLVSDAAPVSLIGDAPQDVEAARANRIRAIAVRTGITPPADLEATQPDVLLEDLTHLDIDRHLQGVI